MVDISRSIQQRADAPQHEHDRYLVYRQRASRPSVGHDDVLLGSYASCDDALDACDADVLTQLAEVGGFHREVAHLIAVHSSEDGVSYHPMIASVGGRRLLTGESLKAELVDTERWLRSQRLD